MDLGKRLAPSCPQPVSSLSNQHSFNKHQIITAWKQLYATSHFPMLKADSGYSPAGVARRAHPREQSARLRISQMHVLHRCRPSSRTIGLAIIRLTHSHMMRHTTMTSHDITPHIFRDDLRPRRQASSAEAPAESTSAEALAVAEAYTTKMLRITMRLLQQETNQAMSEWMWEADRYPKRRARRRC